MVNKKSGNSGNKPRITNPLTPAEMTMLQALLERLITNSNISDKLKNILIQLLKAVGVVVNPGGGTVPVPSTDPWWKKVLNIILNIASFVLPFILKSRVAQRKQRRLERLKARGRINSAKLQRKQKKFETWVNKKQTKLDKKRSKKQN